MKHVVSFLRSFYSSLSQIRTQLRFLSVKWPLTATVVDMDGEMKGLRVVADVVLHSVRGKCSIEFVFDAGTLVRWPFSVQDVVCAVRPVYGSGFECVSSLLPFLPLLLSLSLPLLLLPIS